MKKTLPFILLIGLFLVSACTNTKTGSLEAFYKKEKIESIDKVTIQDGSTGASKTITKEEQIDEFLSLIKDIEFSPADHQEGRKGWKYKIQLFEREKEFNFTLNKIGNIYYDSNPDIHSIIENYYKQLNIE